MCPASFLQYTDLTVCSFHSGAQPIAPLVSTSALSTAALDAAVREYDEDENTETDGENGDHSD
jgi:hypothetical protein